MTTSAVTTPLNYHLVVMRNFHGNMTSSDLPTQQNHRIVLIFLNLGYLYCHLSDQPANFRINDLGLEVKEEKTAIKTAHFAPYFNNSSPISCSCDI